MLRTCLVSVLLLTPRVLAGELDLQPRLPSPTTEVAPEHVAPPLPGVESVASLNLTDLEGISLQNNPTLVAARAVLEAARGRQIQSGRYPNPVIGYHGVELGLRDTAGQQGGFVNQQFITAGKLGLDQAIAGKDIEAALFRLGAQQQRVLSDVRVRFYMMLVSQQRVALTAELARLGDALVSATEQLIAGRLAADNDLLQAQIRADESQILLDNARNQNIELWRRLAAVVGLPAMSMSPLIGELEADLPAYEWEDCYASVLGANPALQAAHARVERAQIAIRRATVEPIPNVDLFVSVRHHNVTQDDVANVQLGVPIPIFNKNQGNILSAQAEWVAARSEVKRIELELQDRLAVAHRRYANARQQVTRYRERMVPRAEKSLALVTGGYEHGQVQYLTLLNAQQTYIQVNLAYLDALQEFRVASSIIDSQLLTGSLQWRPNP